MIGCIDNDNVKNKVKDPFLLQRQRQNRSQCCMLIVHSLSKVTISKVTITYHALWSFNNPTETFLFRRKGDIIHFLDVS
jgi:hypothetical protein